jgi:hypothetical protein
VRFEVGIDTVVVGGTHQIGYFALKYAAIGSTGHGPFFHNLCYNNAVRGRVFEERGELRGCKNFKRRSFCARVYPAAMVPGIEPRRIYQRSAVEEFARLFLLGAAASSGSFERFNGIKGATVNQPVATR